MIETEVWVIVIVIAIGRTIVTKITTTITMLNGHDHDSPSDGHLKDDATWSHTQIPMPSQLHDLIMNIYWCALTFVNQCNW